jgi:hypothetical protein
MTIFGTPGNDHLTGTADDDTFDLSQGGNDKVQGLGGDDTFILGAAFNNNDALDGGDGNDTLVLDGDYSHTIALKAGTVANLENITFAAGFDYSLRMDDASLPIDQTMTIDASALGAGNHLRFNASDDEHDAGRYIITGGAGDDVIIAGNNSDTITPGAGNDTIEALDGNDTILFGGNFTGLDRVDGGGNSDVVVLDGDYSAGVVFRSTTINAGTLQLNAANDYRLIGHGNFNLDVVDATRVGAGNSVYVDTGSPQIGRSITFEGGSGEDVYRGSQGYFSTVVFDNGTFNVADRLSTGAFGGTLEISGDYAPLVFHASTMHGFTGLTLGAGHDYSLTLNDANVAAGSTLEIAFGPNEENNSLDFNGRHETDARLTVLGGGGTNVIYGGHMNDLLRGEGTLVGGDGNDTLDGGGDNGRLFGDAGDDQISIGLSAFANNTAVVNGGTGNDTLTISADFAGTYTLGPGSIHSVEAIVDMPPFQGGDISLVLDASVVTAGHAMSITGFAAVDASAVAGAVTFNGAGNYAGGSGDDTFNLTQPGNTETGNAGDDRFVFDDHYLAFIIGAGANYTTIGGFDPTVDHIDLPVAVTGINAEVTVGALNTATFTSDLETAIRSSKLAAGHAVLFQPNSGDLAGQLFLIVDQNGHAGFQNTGADADLYVHLTSGLNLGSLAASTFEVIQG